MSQSEDVDEKWVEPKWAYERPSVTVIGTVSNLTLGPKVFNAADGASFFGVPEGFGS